MSKKRKELQIKKLNLSDPMQRAEFQAASAEVGKLLEPLVRAIKDGQQISDKDLKTVINCKGSRSNK